MSGSLPPTEIEAKFSLTDPARGEALARAATLRPGIALGILSERIDHDDYVDGAALPILHAGWALRYRTRILARGGGAAALAAGSDGSPVVKHIVTLKQLHAASAAGAADPVHARTEYEGPAVGTAFDPAGWPEGVRAAAEAACGGPIPPLEVLFTLIQRRQVRTVYVGGAAAGELSIDTVRVHLAGDAPRGADAVARFDEVEFELAPGVDTAVLDRVVPALATACGGTAAHGSKFDTAIALLAAAPAAASQGEAARARLMKALAALGRPAHDGA